MHVLLLAFILGCVMVKNCAAQSFKLELQGGLAGTQMSGDQLGGFDKVGLVAGAGVSRSIGQKGHLGFRMLYFQKGSQQRVKTDTLKMEVDYYLLRLNYLEIPISYRHMIRERFMIEGGPSLGVLLSSKEEDENGELAFERPFYKLDFSLYGSVGYEIRSDLSFQFSYFQGIVPVRPHLSGSTFRLNRGQYSSAIVFTLVYQFGALD
jgi:hypothetical protein